MDRLIIGLFFYCSAHYKLFKTDNSLAHIILMSEPECMLCMKKGDDDKFDIVFVVSS